MISMIFGFPSVVTCDTAGSVNESTTKHIQRYPYVYVDQTTTWFEVKEPVMFLQKITREVYRIKTFKDPPCADMKKVSNSDLELC